MNPTLTPADKPWQKAKKSGGNGGDCFELARVNGKILVRDTKQNGQGPVLDMTIAELAAFIDGARNGEFDHMLEG